MFMVEKPTSDRKPELVRLDQEGETLLEEALGETKTIKRKIKRIRFQ